MNYQAIEILEEKTKILEKRWQVQVSLQGVGVVNQYEVDELRLDYLDAKLELVREREKL